jgi:hypothetical protein
MDLLRWLIITAKHFTEESARNHGAVAASRANPKQGLGMIQKKNAPQK